MEVSQSCKQTQPQNKVPQLLTDAGVDVAAIDGTEVAVHALIKVMTASR